MIILINMIDSLSINQISTSFDLVYFINYIKRKLSKIRTTLSCNVNNKSFFQSFSPLDEEINTIGNFFKHFNKFM